MERDDNGDEVRRRRKKGPGSRFACPRPARGSPAGESRGWRGRRRRSSLDSGSGAKNLGDRTRRRRPATGGIRSRRGSSADVAQRPRQGQTFPPAVWFHPLAEAEVLEASTFYEEAVSSLGSAFLDELQAGLRTICRFPEAAPLIGKEVRRKVLGRFPFSLLYRTHEGLIDVLAVMNHRRRPSRAAHRRRGR